MKGFVVFAAISLIFFASFVSADDPHACVDGQTILKISGLTNAHGEKFNGGGSYTTDICYNELFGKTYAGANPHVCNVTNGKTVNFVLALSADTDAHAANVTSNGYATKICYGDLVCTTRTGFCQTGEKTIVKLSGSTDAHLEVRSQNTPNYGVRICCSSAQAGNLACNNNNVKEGTELCDGTALDGKSCTDFGFTGGTLKCATSCEFDTSSCTGNGGGGPGNGGPLGCSKYDGDVNKALCNAVNETHERDTLKQDPAWTSSCDKGDVTCQCIYKDSDKTCQFRKKSNPTDDQNGGNGCTNTCDSTSQQGSCIGGYLNVKINSVYTGTCQPADPACKSVEKTLICGSPTVKLPFFGNAQMLSTLLLLGVIYAIFIIKKKK